MDLDQARCLENDPTWKVIPPHPITVVKATFLEYETKWPKVKYLLDFFFVY